MAKKKTTKKKAKSKKKKKTKTSKKTRESKKGYQVVPKKNHVLLEIPVDEEEEEKTPEKTSGEERYMEEFRQYIDEDESEEEDIGQSDNEETWSADE